MQIEPQAKTVESALPQAATPMLPVAQVIPFTEAEGPGRRFALWLQGCPLRCPGCCNPEMLPFSGGTPTTVAAMVEQIRQAQEKHLLEGITLLGGEPSAHPAATTLAEEVQKLGLTVMLFSGYYLEDLQARNDSTIDRLLAATDILVDGPYERDKPETGRRWIGSANQRIHFLTDRYQANDERWRSANTLELRLVDGQLTVNGFPAKSAVGFWRRPPKPTASKPKGDQNSGSTRDTGGTTDNA